VGSGGYTSELAAHLVKSITLNNRVLLISLSLSLLLIPFFDWLRTLVVMPFSLLNAGGESPIICDIIMVDAVPKVVGKD